MNLNEIKAGSKDVLRGNITPLNKAGTYTGKIVVECYDSVPTKEATFTVVVEAPSLELTSSISFPLVAQSGGGTGATVTVNSNLLWSVKKVAVDSSGTNWLTVNTLNSTQFNTTIASLMEISESWTLWFQMTMSRGDSE